MFSNDERVIYAKRQLVEVICQLRFPEILKIDVSEPADFQERIRRDYPQYEKKIEQLPPQMVNGKPVPQGTVNNYQFISAEGQWRVSLTKGFIALSTYGYTRWEDFAQRLDRVLAACKANGKLSMIYAGDPAGSARLFRQGFDCVACGMDSILLIQAAKQLKADVEALL